MDQLYYQGFAPGVTGMLRMSGWGWHIETAVHMLRLTLGGAFDKYPKLQVIVGHMGEAVTFMLPRVEEKLKQGNTKLARPMGAYLRENFYYTFGGFTYLPSFQNMLAQVGIDRIMFSADYPFGSMADTRNFLEQLPISQADKDKIAHGNAARVLPA